MAKEKEKFESQPYVGVGPHYNVRNSAKSSALKKKVAGRMNDKKRGEIYHAEMKNKP